MENNTPAQGSIPNSHHNVVDRAASKRKLRVLYKCRQKRIELGYLNIQWTLSVLNPASSFLQSMSPVTSQDHLLMLSCSHLPRVSTWSPNLSPAMAAGLPGTTRDTNTPLLWAETLRPTWREMRG